MTDKTPIEKAAEAVLIARHGKNIRLAPGFVKMVKENAAIIRRVLGEEVYATARYVEDDLNQAYNQCRRDIGLDD